MTGEQLKRYRKEQRLTQEQAADALGVSQTYLSLMESGERPLTDGLKKKAVRVFGLSSAELPAVAAKHEVRDVSDDRLTAELAGLGYSGFAHWKRSSRRHPADVLLSGLKAGKRDVRLVEALPWVLLEYHDLEWSDLTAAAKVFDLQNRVGFVTNVAKRVAEFRGDRKTSTRLGLYETELRRSKLERLETLCNETMTRAERRWLEKQRPEAAREWNLLTDLSPENVDYYA